MTWTISHFTTICWMSYDYAWNGPPNWGEENVWSPKTCISCNTFSFSKAFIDLIVEKTDVTIINVKSSRQTYVMKHRLMDNNKVYLISWNTKNTFKLECLKIYTCLCWDERTYVYCRNYIFILLPHLTVVDLLNIWIIHHGPAAWIQKPSSQHTLRCRHSTVAI